MTETLALEVRELSKTFGEHRALSNMSFDVRAGEIHALVGENGCGKSTFVKCLSGYHTPDPGAEIIVGGTATEHAAGMGLAFVHQDLGLIPSLSVAANLQLGQPPLVGFGWRLRHRREAQLARQALGRLKRTDINPRSMVSELSVASQTIVALARCLGGSAQNHLLVLDEPTAALPEREVEQLFDALNEARSHGVGVIYISHKLDEIFAIADRVTVLRDGKKVATHLVADITREQLVEEIVGHQLEVVGHELEQTHEAIGEKANAPVVLAVDSVSGHRVAGVSFAVRRGEVVGIAGLLGCGKSELGRLLFGAQPLSAGSIEIDGAAVHLKTPKQAMAVGVALVPANRHRDGLLMNESAGDNIMLLDTRKYWRGGVFRETERRTTMQALIEAYDVRPRDPKKIVALLSGGNQQKAVIAKWVHRTPTVLILDEPAQGVDVGAKAQIFNLLDAAAQAGMALIVISEEFEDLAQICDRVLVMSGGKLVADLSGQQKTRQRISSHAFEKAAL